MNAKDNERAWASTLSRLLLGTLAVFCVVLWTARVDAVEPTGKITKVTKVSAKPNGAVQLSGKIDAGTRVALGWAAQSSVACFPATRFDHFDGNHVVFETSIPAHAEMTITATPKDGSTDISLYAYQLGTTSNYLPPNLPGAVACEASYGTSNIKQPYNPGQAETVKLNAINNPYKVIIGVAGAQKLTKGSFTLKIELKVASAAPTGKITSATKINAKPNDTVQVTGSLDGGTQIALGWAAQSSVACFPATKNDHFDGNHVAFETSIPPYAEMTITAKPKDGSADISLYAYEVGTTSKYLPPNLPGAVTCEASYGTNKMSQPYNPGQAETVKLNAIKNPYKVIIGVAGARKLTKGSFTLEIQLKVASAAPTGKITSATKITAKPNDTVQVTGSLDGGTQIALGWAAQSSVACFPATKNDHFDGNHVAFETSIPPYAEMTITAKPKDGSADISLYAYEMGTTSKYLPPNLPGAVTCEASYGTNKMSQPYNPGQAETVKLNAIKNPYKVIIGVAGARKLTKGSFTLEIQLKVASAAPTGKITSATKINAKPNDTVQVTGSLDGGTQIALGWAAQSSVACFPATKADHFDGNHVAFETSIPPYAEMTITATPKDGSSDISLYAYEINPKSKYLPPSLPGAVACEASYGTNKMSQPYNPGQAETVKLNAIKNPYKVVIGVAGARKLTQGSFTLKIELKVAGPAPTGKIASASKVTAKPNATVQTTGALDGGAQIALGWAAQSSVTCFPATKNDHFDGNHVAFETSIPPYAEMTITATPKDGSTDISLYAYEIAPSSSYLPPNLPGAVACEASYGTNKMSQPYNPGQAETVKLNAIKNPYKVIIGVAGARKLTKGSFTLQIHLKTK